MVYNLLIALATIAYGEEISGLDQKSFKGREASLYYLKQADSELVRYAIESELAHEISPEKYWRLEFLLNYHQKRFYEKKVEKVFSNIDVNDLDMQKISPTFSFYIIEYMKERGLVYNEIKDLRWWVNTMPHVELADGAAPSPNSDLKYLICHGVAKRNASAMLFGGCLGIPKMKGER